MKPFEYISPTALKDVPALLTGNAVVMAGGSDLLGLMKEGIVQPSRVVNLKNVAELKGIQPARGGLRIGAVVTLAALLENSDIRQRYPALATAAHEAGPPQVRNVGTVGGELCQRPHCYYFRVLNAPACTRRGGAQCPAATAEGLSKWHAIFANDRTPDVSASDLAPALIAYGASVSILGADGKERTLPLEQFFVNDPQKETVLGAQEIVTAVTLPAVASGTKGHFIKFKERDSYDFALVSVAVVVRKQGETVRDARVVLGGVAPTPWRSKEAEAAVVGKPLTEQTATAAGEAAVKAARPLKDNAYKVQLARVLIKRALLATA
ncbi:MAG: xanthine dehydrogenase family protein subunit M [Abditibacteriales bacterium]|nr:xanthine dehydrogenase family protein subunit M [Abditibacteriales bacterium]MDW8364254.1 xanthine dehydrogenase family protein subunit M [Abditibacteriales bacterium]